MGRRWFDFVYPERSLGAHHRWFGVVQRHAFLLFSDPMTVKRKAKKSSLASKKSLFLGRYTEIKVEKAFEWPMTFLTLALIPVMGVPALYSLTPFQERVFSFVDIGIWGTFYFEFFTKMFVAKDKSRAFRRNWLLALVLLVPALRLFKLARLARLLRFMRLLRFH